MAKAKVRNYISKQPGYRITLPEGMVYIDPFGSEKKSVLFPARGGKMVKTSQAEIQDFIEGVKDPKGDFEFKNVKYSTLPCRAFQREMIERIPTKEEIEERELQRKQSDALATLKDFVSKPGVTIEFDKMNDAEIRDLAGDIGVPTSKDGKKLAAADIAKAVEQKIFGKADKQ